MLQPPRENEPADAEQGQRFAKRVLLVGWDGVEFSTLSPLLQSGLLPNLRCAARSRCECKPFRAAPRPFAGGVDFVGDRQATTRARHSTR